ncbi:GMC oxidoreductase [Colletotrichum camelliae]|nr:GMC oxidoreductase [Colletotrichum camelliae]
MLSHTLFCFAAAMAAMTQPALGLPTEQLEARQTTMCSFNEKTWTATMTGTCSIDGGPAMTCDQTANLKTVVVKQNTMNSAAGLGNNQFECKGYQNSMDSAQPEDKLRDIASEPRGIVIGGGTAGLTVADRLSEDPKKTVLVIEYGRVAVDDSFMPPFNTPAAEFLYNLTSVPQRNANNRVFPKEHGNGNAYGLIWIPSSCDPSRAYNRSFGGLGHYQYVQPRQNYHLLPLHRGLKVNFERRDVVQKAVSVQVKPRFGDGATFDIKAKREIILSASATRTPIILQLSGIGPKKVVEEAGIKSLINLPGVGWNLQDHSHTFSLYNFTKDVWPTPTTIHTNATFRAEALADYKAHNTGPFTSPTISGGLLLPARSFTGSHFANLSLQLGLQAAHKYYLPDGLDPTLTAGYILQQKILLKSFLSEKSAIFEHPFQGSPRGTSILLKPFSRGSVNINPKDPFGDPIFDYRLLSNPIDLEIHVRMQQYIRSHFATSKTLSALGPVELVPGKDRASDAQVKKWLVDEENLNASNGHSCGTASMMPRLLGGVVDSNLKVYGTSHLSIADTSIIPLLVGAHTMSTAQRDIAAEAYLDAIQYLEAEFRDNDQALKWLQNATSTSLEDLLETTRKAENKHRQASKKKDKIIRWLEGLSTRVMYYGRVFDTLAQHHPEYVGLVWGAMKFVLMVRGIISHGNLVAQFSQALSTISEVLPNVKVTAELYQTEQVKHAIASLYAHVVLFLKQALKWYNVSPASRIVKSLFKPFELSYKETVDQIKRCAQTINNIADVAAKSEIREVNVYLRDQTSKVEDLERQLHNMQEGFNAAQAELTKMMRSVLQIASRDTAKLTIFLVQSSQDKHRKKLSQNINLLFEERVHGIIELEI